MRAGEADDRAAREWLGKWVELMVLGPTVEFLLFLFIFSFSYYVSFLFWIPNLNLRPFMSFTFKLDVHISILYFIIFIYYTHFHSYNIFFFFSFFSKFLNFPLGLKFYFWTLIYFFSHDFYIMSQNAHHIKSSMIHILVAFMLLIICFYIGCSHVMMHKGQTHI